MLYIGIYRIALELSRKAEEKHKKTASIVAQRAMSQMDSAAGGGTSGGTSQSGTTPADAAAAVLQRAVQQQHFGHVVMPHTPVSGRQSTNTAKDDDDPTSSCSPEPGLSTLEAPTTSSGSRSPKMQITQSAHQKPEAQQQQHTVLVEPNVELHHLPVLESSPTSTPTPLKTGLQRIEPEMERTSVAADEEPHATLVAAASSPPAATSVSHPPRADRLQSPSRQLSVPSTTGVQLHSAKVLESGRREIRIIHVPICVFELCDAYGDYDNG